MKHVYLTEKLPENQTGLDKQSPDIRQKIEAYGQGKQDYANIPPAIRPLPLEKYRTNKYETHITPRDRDAEISDPVDGDEDNGLDPETRKSEELFKAVESLPKFVRSKARRLVPHLARVRVGSLDLRDLLYDLTVPKVKRIRSQSLEQLASVYRQLESDSSMDQRLIVNKLAASATPSKKRHHQLSSGHPRRSIASRWAPLAAQYYKGSGSTASAWV